MNNKLLEIKNLTIKHQEQLIVSNINLSIKQNEIIGIVGESGSGKSTILNAIDGLLNKKLKIVFGKIIYNDKIFSSNDILDLRGSEISYIFQDPVSYLNPTMRVGKQIEENVINKMSKSDSKVYTFNILKEVGFKKPEEIFDRYPHELSGGQCQKIMIASAISLHPKLILADEPTSSLDLNLRDDILSLLKNIKEKEKTSIILVSHDFQSLINYVDKLYVLNKGKIIEEGLTKNVVNNPQKEYTKKLIDSTICLSYEGEEYE